MRYIFIILLLLAAAGAGVWWFHFHDATPTVEIPDPPPPVDPVPGVGVTIPAPGSKTTPPEEAPTDETASSSPNEENTVSAEDEESPETIVTFDVIGTMYSFSPATMNVKKGDRVRINFTSQNGNHDFVIDELGARTAVLPSGKSESIEFVADQAGEFEYYCSVGGHRQMGMKGTLTVSE